MSRGRLLWVSAYNIEKPISFNVQLDVVSKALVAKGWEVVVAEPGLPGGKPWIDADGRTRINYDGRASLRGLAREVEARAVVIHGYMDMFPAVGEAPGIPVYLWGQTSGARPGLEGLCEVRPPFWVVPVTERSGEIFRKAGVGYVAEAIPHAVDETEIHPVEAGVRSRWRAAWGVSRAFVIGSVGTNQARKGLRSLLEAFERLPGRDGKVKLVMRTELKSPDGGPDLDIWRSRLGPGSLTVVEDYLPRARMNELYGIMDLYCQASEWEGFSIPVIEAMAAALPVVAHDIQGPSELVPYRELLVPSVARRTKEVNEVAERTVDVGELASLLAWACEHRDELKHFGELGRREVERRFSLDVVAEAWSRLLA